MTETLDYAELEQLSTETDDDDDLVRKLRRSVKAAGKHARDRDDIAAENQTLKLDRLVRDADIDGLNKDQRETLTEWAAKQSELTAEQIHTRAVALGWAEAKADPAQQEIDEHSEITKDAGGAPVKGAHQITPADYETWDHAKRRSFRSKHPEAFEKLKQGEAVTGIAF